MYSVFQQVASRANVPASPLQLSARTDLLFLHDLLSDQQRNDTDFKWQDEMRDVLARQRLKIAPATFATVWSGTSSYSGDSALLSAKFIGVSKHKHKPLYGIDQMQVGLPKDPTKSAIVSSSSRYLTLDEVEGLITAAGNRFNKLARAQALKGAYVAAGETVRWQRLTGMRI